jgi:dihydrofolate reductase
MAVFIEISMSLDGYVAGPNPTREEPLGERGEELHEWVVQLASWRGRHGLEGGTTGPADDLVQELSGNVGANVMGRRMFSGGEGPWEDDTNADGWWGDEPPFRVPVFVVTHHPRETVSKAGGTTFTFVTDGVVSAVEQAKAAAGDRDVLISGGGSVAQQALSAGLVDRLELHVVPILLGGGVRLFDGSGPGATLEQTRVVESPGVAHLGYRVVS